MNLDIVGKYFIVIAYNYIVNLKKSLLLQREHMKLLSVINLVRCLDVIYNVKVKNKPMIVIKGKSIHTDNNFAQL